ncbi:MAG: NAD(P)/FAD-dependent oxidoreductase [Bacteroidota bacterium]
MDANVIIIGAGISGLIAARNLEEFGYKPTILEASDGVGGRVKTDILSSYQLDHGFQVLLDAYPMAQKYLNYDELNLQQLLPGSLIYKNGDGKMFGDPLRDSSFLMPTVFSSLAGLFDKWKIFRLNSTLKGEEVSKIFTKAELSTADYLKDHGFSSNVIENFFRPFFSGIFLEPELATSSRMFEFVYKMFGEGNAVIPKAGMGAIAKQLSSSLKQTSIRLNSKVLNVNGQQITLENDEVLNYDFVIIATDPGKIMRNFASTLDWKSCENLYFTSKSRAFNQPIIGLNANEESLVNNIFYPTSIETESKGDSELLSVTVVKDHNLEEDELVEQVKQDLHSSFNISDLTFLKRYKIPHALPSLEGLAYSREENESLLTERIALAGDHQLNGSLNAAMVSGESAAKIAHQAISDTLLHFG